MQYESFKLTLSFILQLPLNFDIAIENIFTTFAQTQLQ